MDVNLTECLPPTLAAARLGISVSTLRLLALSGRIKAMETPIGRLYAREEIERVAAQRTQQKEAVTK